MTEDGGRMAEMVKFFYRGHYLQKISPNLSPEQKRVILMRISDMTLYEPFSFTGENYVGRFPELAPFVNVELSGLYLVAIMECIVSEIQHEARKSPEG